MKLPTSTRAKQMLEHQDVVTLRAAGYDWPEIAKQLSMSVTKVKTLCAAAIAEIKDDVDNIALSILNTDVRLCDAAIEALKSRVATGEPIALADMRAMQKLRQETVLKAREVRASQLLAVPPEKGAGADGEDAGPRVRLNFVRLGQARPGHKPEEVDDAS